MPPVSAQTHLAANAASLPLPMILLIALLSFVFVALVACAACLLVQARQRPRTEDVESAQFEPKFALTASDLKSLGDPCIPNISIRPHLPKSAHQIPALLVSSPVIQLNDPAPSSADINFDILLIGRTTFTEETARLSISTPPIQHESALFTHSKAEESTTDISIPEAVTEAEIGMTLIGLSLMGKSLSAEELPDSPSLPNAPLGTFFSSDCSADFSTASLAASSSDISLSLQLLPGPSLRTPIPTSPDPALDRSLPTSIWNTTDGSKLAAEADWDAILSGSLEPESADDDDCSFHLPMTPPLLPPAPQPVMHAREKERKVLRSAYNESWWIQKEHLPPSARKHGRRARMYGKENLVGIF